MPWWRKQGLPPTSFACAKPRQRGRIPKGETMPWFFHALAPEAEQQKRAGARVCGEVNNNLIGRAGNSWRIVLHTEAEAAETQSQGLSMPVSRWPLPILMRRGDARIPSSSHSRRRHRTRSLFLQFVASVNRATVPERYLSLCATWTGMQ